jgi:outer membrane protein
MACGVACSRPQAEVRVSGDVPTVAVAKVTRGDISQVPSVASEFRPYQEIDVHAKVAGYVKSITVDVGDRVKPGQLLAVLEIPELQDELQQDEASVKRAGEEVNRAQADLERAESAHEVTHLGSTRLASVSRTRPNLIAQQDLDEAAGRDRVSEAQVSTAKAALAASSLKSGLDVSLAKVNLSEAQLLLVQAHNDVQRAYASLSAALGSPQTTTYELTEEDLPAAPADDGTALVARALRERPDIAAQRLAGQAAETFATAERSLWMPSLSFVGAAGFTPYHQIGLNDRYSAAGINVTIPLSNGSLYSARHAEAAFRAQSQDQALRDLENRVSRDVTVAWLDVRTAYQRLDLTNQLLAQASDALELAQARYHLGLSSIVELTQAQLNKTSAQIAQATARYDYQSRSATLRFQTGELP